MLVQLFGELKDRDNVDMIINENFETSIDIHNEFDFFIAEKALEYLKEHNPEKGRIIFMTKN